MEHGLQGTMPAPPSGCSKWRRCCHRSYAEINALAVGRSPNGTHFRIFKPDSSSLRLRAWGLGKSIIKPPSNQAVFAILLVVAIGWLVYRSARRLPASESSSLVRSDSKQNAQKIKGAQGGALLFRTVSTGFHHSFVIQFNTISSDRLLSLRLRPCSG